VGLPAALSAPVFALTFVINPPVQIREGIAAATLNSPSDQDIVPRPPAALTYLAHTGPISVPAAKTVTNKL